MVEVEVEVGVGVGVGSGVAVSVGVEAGIWVDVGSGVSVAVDEAVGGGAAGSWDRRSSAVRLAQLAAPRALTSPSPQRRKNSRRDSICLLAC